MQHLDDRQHSSTRYQNVQSIDQRIEFVRLVRIHELFRLTGFPLATHITWKRVFECLIPL